MAIKDFRAARARIFKIIASGSGLSGTPSLVIHSSSWRASVGGASGHALYGGTTTNPGMGVMLASVGRDVEVFLSGNMGQKGRWLTRNTANNVDGGVTLIGGDLVVSGALYDGAGVEFTHDWDWTDGGNKLYTTSSVVIGIDKFVDTLTGPAMDDANLFVFGVPGSRGGSTRGTAVFGGDLVVSGTLYAEKQVIEVDETATGSLMVSGSLFVSKSIEVHGYKTVDTRQQVAIHIWDKPGWGGSSGAIVWDNNDAAIYESGGDLRVLAKDQLALTGSTVFVNRHVDSGVKSDISVFVSGTAHSFDETLRGTTLFDGDTVISGGLKVFGSRTSTESAEGGTISGSIHFTEGGLPYLKQGPGIGIASGANGQVTIRNTSAYEKWTLAADSGPAQEIMDGDSVLVIGGDGLFTRTSATDQLTIGVDTAEIGAIITGTFNVPVPSEFVTTASVSLAGSELGFTYTADFGREDTYFFVSGTKGGKNSATHKGVSVFGGDTAISGVLYVGDGNGAGSSAELIARITHNYVNSWLDISAQNNNFILSPSGSGARKLIVRPEGDSRGTFQVQSASNSGYPVFTVDTTNQRIGVGIDNPDHEIHLHGADDGATMKWSSDATGAGGLDGVLVGLKGDNEFELEHLESEKPIKFRANYGSSGTELLSVGGAGSNKQVLVMSGGAKLSVDEGKYTDVGFYVSGSTRGRGGSTGGLALFGGDVTVSGTLHVSGTEISVFERGVLINSSRGESNFDSFIVKSGISAGISRELITAKNDYVHILSGGISTGESANPMDWIDTAFFVSGAIGKKDSATKGTSVFGGDTVISGTLYGGYFAASLQALRIGGHALLKDAPGSTQYFNFGNSTGVVGYGFRSNAGTMQFKNQAGAWSNFGGGATADVSGTFNVPSPSEFVTTASVSLAGGEGFVHTADFGRIDTYFFVSGTQGSRGTTTKGTSVFGGDVVISGSLNGGSPLQIGGWRTDLGTDVQAVWVANPGGNSVALFDGDILTSASFRAKNKITADLGLSGSLTRLTDGSSYLIAGSGIDITSASNGAVTITGTAVSAEWTDEGSILRPNDGVADNVGIGGDGSVKSEYPIYLNSNGIIETNNFITASMGFSGSLTKLNDGTSYLIAGTGMEITSASNGAVTISNASLGEWTDGGLFLYPTDGGGGRDVILGDSTPTNADIILRQAGGAQFNRNHLNTQNFEIMSDNKAAFVVSSSVDRVLILSGGAAADTDRSKAADVSFFVSGSKDGALTGRTGTSLFDGDVVMSGGLYLGSRIYNEGNTDSYIRPQENRWRIFANTLEVADFNMSLSQATTFFNRQKQDIDFVVGSDNKLNAIKVDASIDQVLVLSGGAGISPDAAAATDVAFFVSGGLGSRAVQSDGVERGVSVFAGDVVISGSLFVSGAAGDHHPAMMTQGGTISGSIHQTAQGLSYLVGGTGVTIASSSNGQVTISSTAGSEWSDGGLFLYPTDGGGVQDIVLGDSTTTNADIILRAAGGAQFNRNHDPTQNFEIMSDNKAAFVVSSSADRVLILSGGAAADVDRSKAADVAFFVSGGLGSRAVQADGIERGVSVFAGDVVISGSLFVSGAAGDHHPAMMSQGGTISGSIHQTAQGLSYLVAGTGVTIASSSNGQVTINSTATSAEWTDEGAILRPADGVAEHVGIGGSGAVTTDYDIFLSASGGAVFNQKQLNSANADFRVATNTKETGLLVRAADNEVIILANSETEYAGEDVSFYVSGSAGSRGLSSQGTSVIGGDLVISGGLHGGSPLQIGDFRTDLGPDVGLFVSGGLGHRARRAGGSGAGDHKDIAVFAGDVVISGSLFVSGATGDHSIAQVTPGGTISGSIHKTSQGLSYLVAGAGVNIVSASNGQVTITSTAVSAEWTDEGDILRPNEAAGDSVGIGATGNTSTAYPIYLDKNGSAIFNQLGASADFRVASNLKANALLVDGSEDRVLILSGGDSLSQNEAEGADVVFYVSGSKDVLNSGARGLSLFGGDLITSGAARTHRGAEVNADKGSGDFVHFGSTATKEMIASMASLNQVFVLSDTSEPEGTYTDIAFYVSGSVGSKGTTTKGTALFGGDAVVSGTLHIDGATTYGAANQAAIVFNTNRRNSINWDTNDDGAGPDASIHEAGGGLYITSIQQVLILSGGDSASADETTGADIAFYVSGSVGSQNTTERGTALFGGDLAVSGTSHLGAGSSGITSLNVYSNVSGDFAALIDNDHSSAGHVLKLLTDGNGSGTTIMAMEDGDGDTLFKARADGRFGFGPNGVAAMGAGTFVVGIDGSHTADIAISKRMQHLGDSNTYMDFPSLDEIQFVAGGLDMIHMIEDGSDSQILIFAAGADVTNSQDVNFWVSGSIGSKSQNTRGTALFGGDVAISGTLHIDGANSYEGASGAAIVFNTTNTNKIVWDTQDDGNSPDAQIFEGSGRLNISGSNDIRIRATNDVIVSGSNDVTLWAGNDVLVLAQDGLNYARFEDQSGQKVTRFNSSNANIDFRVANTVHDRALQVDASEKTVSIDRKAGEANPGLDINFYVSGSTGSRNTAIQGTSLFGGDLIVSGGMQVDVDTFVVDEFNNRVGVGVGAPNAKMNISSDANGETLVSIEQHNDNPDAPNLEFVKSRGTYAAPAVIQTGDFLGDLQFKAYDGNSEDQWAGMYVQSYGNVSNTSHPAKLFVRSCPDGSTSLSNAAIFQGGTWGTISGSIQQTVSGLPYLVSGDNISIVSSSNGQVTINSLAAGGADADWKDGNDKLVTTSSVSIAGGLGDSHWANTGREDTFFFVSGTIGGKHDPGNNAGVATFGGDVVTSGALYVEGHSGAGSGFGAYSAAIILNSVYQSRIVWDTDPLVPGLVPNAMIYESGGTFHVSASDSIELKIDSLGGDGITLEAPTVTVNEAGLAYDFRVESNNLAGAFIVDGDVNQVIVGHGGTNAGSVGPGIGADVTTILSGTRESIDTSTMGGVTVVAGDLVVSGAIYEPRSNAAYSATIDKDSNSSTGEFAVWKQSNYAAWAYTDVIPAHGVTADASTGNWKVDSTKQDKRQMLYAFTLNLGSGGTGHCQLRIRDQAGGPVVWTTGDNVHVDNNYNTNYSAQVILPAGCNPCLTVEGGGALSVNVLDGSTITYRSIT